MNYVLHGVLFRSFKAILKACRTWEKHISYLYIQLVFSIIGVADFIERLHLYMFSTSHYVLLHLDVQIK